MSAHAGPARLAVLGDVHANLTALDAVLDAIRDRAIDDGVCTGDLVLRGTEPDACVSRIALRGWPTVCGNTDVKVATRSPRPRNHPASSRVGSRSWTRHRLSDASVAFLAACPLTLRVPLGPFSILVMHASPEDPTDALVDQTTTDAALRAIARELRADAVVSGHTHRQIARSVDGCLFLNPGSVGESPDRDERPRWAWLEAGPSGPVAHLERVDAPVAGMRAPRGRSR